MVWITILELVVVGVEAALIVAVSRGQFLSKQTASKPIRFRQAAIVSLVANTVSVAVSVTAPVVLFGLLLNNR